MKGVPKLRGNAFYRCASCCHGKLCERHVGESRKTMQDQDLNQNKNTIPLTDKGKHFAMDFGFVRGSEFSEKTKDGRTITSVDGFNSYLIIVDKASRYMFTFLTKSKHPPLDIVKSFLTRHGHLSSVGKTIRTDQGN